MGARVGGASVSVGTGLLALRAGRVCPAGAGESVCRL
jgi:hypothetical protein